MSNKISCIIVDDEPMAREILTSFVAKIPQLELQKTCANAMEAFDVLNKKSIDLVFLDINMPEVSGLSLAKSINKKSKIIFTTAYREYAVDGFDLQAVDYLLKPIAFDRFLQAINTYFEVASVNLSTNSSVEKSPKNDFIFVRADRKMLKVNFKEILYIESLSDYIKIHTTNGTIVTRETISNIETKLPQNDFLRVHRSFIVAIQQVSSYTNEFVEIGKKAISISRSYKDVVLTKLQNI